jgi:hypothetical protein
MRGYRSPIRLRTLAAYVPSPRAYLLVAGIVLSAPSMSNGDTICTGSGAGCTGTRSCSAVISVPSLNSTFTINVSGPAFAQVFNSPNHDHLDLVWVQSDFSGTDPVLGDISMHLSTLQPSTGIVVPLTDSAPLPALNTNDLFFEYNFSGLGIPLLSVEPVEIQAVINGIPPDGAIYHLLNPVHLFAEGDPTQSTVAIITSAEILFTATGPQIPIFACPIPEPSSLVLMGLGVAGTFGFRWRRRRTAA